MAINATNYDGTKDYKIAEVGDVYHPNLLINSDFQINQRKQEYYDTSSGWGYGVDMWRSIYCVIGTGITNAISIASDNGYMQQKFPSRPISGDITVRLYASYVDKGSFRVYLEGGTNDGTELVVSEVGVFEHTFKNVSNVTALSISFTNFYGNIAYIDLFEGDIAYPHTKEDYSTSLNRCRRYLLAGYIYAPAYVYNSEAWAIVPLSTQMESTPSVSFGSTELPLVLIEGVDSANASGVNNVQATDNAVVIRMNLKKSLSAQNGKAAKFLNNPCIISCEPL